MKYIFHVLGLCFLVGGCAATSPSLPEAERLTLSDLAEVPAGEYVLTPQNTSLKFSVTPLGVGRVTGEFTDFEAILNFTGRAGEAVSLKAVAQTSSITVPTDFIQNMVVGENWLDVDTYPAALFSGATQEWSMGPQGQPKSQLAGTLTLKEITNPAQFDIELTCDGIELCPERQIGFSGKMTLSRQSYGMTTMRSLVSDEIEMSIAGLLDLTSRVKT
ncbi:MAG: YceI family protein [Pseudomonadota bacterium]